MELLELLAMKSTTLEEVVAHARQEIEIPSDEMLLAVGSLVEGLGTSKSDLDLMLLTNRSAKELSDTAHFNWVSGKCLVDMWVLPKEQIETVLSRFAAWSNAPWDPSDTAPFDLKERTLLHRVATGFWLADAGAPDDEPVPRPAIADIARLKFHGARHEGRSVQVDMVGLRDNGDYRSLAFAAIQLMGLAIDAILAAHELTNFSVKWRSRLLDEVPDSWHPQVNPNWQLPVGMQIWQLLKFPDHYDAASVLPFAHRIAAYARAAFLWSEQAILGNGPTSTMPRFEMPPDNPKATATMPFLEFDVDYDLSDGALSLGRLNEFTDTMPLTPAELAAALLCDGMTSAELAEYWIVKQAGQTLDLGNFLKRCRAHGLIAK